MAKKTKCVNVGGVKIGGGARVSIQSMTNTDTRDVSATLEQAFELYEAGCDILRLAVPDEAAAAAFEKIKARAPLPLIADIHFNWRLALAAIAAGADKIRINPGNIGSRERVGQIAREAAARGIPIRVGVNSGSLEKDLLLKHKAVTAEALCESALRHAAFLEELGFFDIVLSLKSSSVPLTVSAYRLISRRSRYPLHLGVTEAGTEYVGIIKSAAGIGSLLLDNIGDTIRFSLTASPAEEVRAAKALLSALELRGGPQIISCPTCGRCGIDLIKIAKEVEARLAKLDKSVKVAVMGCVVNGPGEAAEADIGIAGGDGCAVLFKGGRVIKKVAEGDIVDELFKEIDKI